MCAKKDPFALADGWDSGTWDDSDAWDVPGDNIATVTTLDKTKLSPHILAKMLERRCAGILDNLTKEENTIKARSEINTKDKKHLELLCATIVTIQTYLKADSILEDILYMGQLWQLISNTRSQNVKLAEDVSLLCKEMAEEYGAPVHELLNA